MNMEQIKREVAALSDHEQAELIRYTLQLRHANDSDYRKEVTQRLNETDKSRWLTPDEFEHRLGNV
jgi:hypothetical protein